MPGTLYVVGTPIGNLEDITLRALRILKSIAVIAAEDTRQTKKLLARYGIATPLTSYYEHNELAKAPVLLARLLEGEDVALVCDAGTPAISDPGYLLVRLALERGVSVVPVPGPSALIAALAAGGLPTDHFVFLGFPPRQGSRLRRFLEQVRPLPWTLVFYESPQRLQALLEAILAVLGDRRVVLARELTKAFEEFRRGTASELVAALRGKTVRGEVTLLVAGAPKGTARVEQTVEELLQEMLKAGELPWKEVVKKVAAAKRIPRKAAYEALLKLKREGRPA